jgi:hypothetical protein
MQSRIVISAAARNQLTAYWIAYDMLKWRRREVEKLMGDELYG